MTTLPLKRKLDDTDHEPTARSHPSFIVGGGVPWMRLLDQHVLHKPSTPVMHRLGYELMAFGNVMAPNSVEEERRAGVIRCLERRLDQFFPGCKLDTTGSTATGLYLPGGDIDVTLMWSGAEDNFGAAANAEDCVLATVKAILDEDRIYGSVVHRQNAQVPIVTITGTYGNYDIDLSFNRAEGTKGVELVKSILRTSSIARPLILVCKLYLKRMKLNKPFDGGIGGFTIVVMVAWFLKTHPKVVGLSADVEDIRNWGQLLVDFFHCFGETFDYKRFGISLRSGGSYITRTTEHESLLVESPFVVGSNMARGCRLYDLRKAFKDARIALTDAIHFQVESIANKHEATWASYLGRMGEAHGSLLHGLIGLDDQMMNCTANAERSHPIAELRHFLRETHISTA